MLGECLFIKRLQSLLRMNSTACYQYAFAHCCALSDLCSQFPLFTLAVMDGRSHIIPVAHFVTSTSTVESIQRFLQSINAAAQKLKPVFLPGSIHCDDDGAEKCAIRLACTTQTLCDSLESIRSTVRHHDKSVDAKKVPA